MKKINEAVNRILGLKYPKNKKISKMTGVVIHAIFLCQDCDSRWEDYITARKEAYSHAKKTGHCVTGETGRGFRYN